MNETTKQPAEASTDDLIELEMHLQQKRALHIATVVRELRISGDMPTAFDAGFDLACEEILHRLEHEEWALSERGWAPVDGHPAANDKGFRVTPNPSPQPEPASVQADGVDEASERFNAAYCNAWYSRAPRDWHQAAMLGKQLDNALRAHLTLMARQGVEPLTAPVQAEPEPHTSNQRSRPVRFEPSVDGRIIIDDDFMYDSHLTVSGDFGDDSDRQAYAQWLCDKLNAEPEPAGDAGMRDRVLSAIYNRSVTPVSQADRSFNDGVNAAWSAANRALATHPEPPAQQGVGERLSPRLRGLLLDAALLCGEQLEAAIDRMSAALATPSQPQAEPVAEFWEHVKTGGLYEWLLPAFREDDSTALIVYRSVETGVTWVRPSRDFYDGRFVRVGGTTPTTINAKGGA